MTNNKDSSNVTVPRVGLCHYPYVIVMSLINLCVSVSAYTISHKIMTTVHLRLMYIHIQLN